MRRYILFLFYIFIVVTTATAQHLTVNVVPNVAAGENVRLSYTIDTQNVEDFVIGNIPEELEMITGPYVSSQSSYRMINGHTSSTSSKTFTYILYAGKSGTYTIPSAYVVVAGKKIYSKPAKIKVSGHAHQSSSAPRMHDEYDNEPHMRNAGSPITGNDLFIKVSANKKTIHEQEVIILTYKVYSLVDLTYLEGNMPDLTGFYTQEIPLPQQKSFHIERVNGKPYRCVTWKQYAMYPQKTGKLEIPSITFTGTVVQQNRNIDPFEAILNGGAGYVEVKRKIQAPGLSIDVKPLPTRPANFSGGVGKFDISAQINKKEVKANDPVTVRVVVSGIGNLKLLKQPQLKLPKDFDKYDAKITDKTRLTSNGVEGNMIYDFLVVPRNQGKYEIPPVEMTYYDSSANTYKTIKTQSFTLDVEKGSGNSSTAETTSLENKDIRPIKEGKASVIDTDNTFFGSASYVTVLTLLFVSFVILLVVFRKRAVQNADIASLKVKKANRVARKRLKVASRLMASNQRDKFYDEVLRALWGYVGDKLRIPVEQLNRENISEKLSLRNVDEETTDMFINAIDECEYNRYAPGDIGGNMSQTFKAAITAIVEIENTLKHSSKRTSTARMLMLMILLVPLCVTAATKQSADSEYKKGNYQQAIKEYEELLKKGASVKLYYNLGNAYYRTDNITRAVLNYERALLLSPGDDDIRFNLQMARSKTIDKISPQPEMFFVTWYKAVVNITSIDGWARLSVISISLALILTLCYLFGNSLMLRKTGFFGGCFFMLVFILSIVFANEQKAILTNRSGAVVVSSSVALKKTPVASSDQTTIIHEGTRVTIKDDTMKDWKQVQLEDGREGWLQTSQIERI
ncbi:MAG: BatD family protein [Prevotella sp.]